MKAYEESLKVFRDNKNIMDYAIETAKQEGKDENKIETAIAMKKEGLSIDLINKITGLPKQQIEKL